MRNTIGKRIRALRDKAGLSQREQARRLKITAVYLCNIERGRHKPSLRMLEKIAMHFKVPVTELLR